MEKTVQEVVAEKISNSGEFVKNTVIDKLADVEINKRVDLITKAIQKQEQLKGELKKISKPDVVTYLGDSPQEAMSKNRFEDIKKMKEKLAKLTSATDAALTSNTTDSYNKLTETLKKLDQSGGNTQQGSGEDE